MVARNEAFELVTDLTPRKQRGVIGELETHVKNLETGLTEGGAGDFAAYRELVGEIRGVRQAINFLKQAESDT